MNIVSYGGGTNSTAMLIECAKRGIPIDLITFADTGGERPHTYAYIDMFGEWCVEHGLPEITIVKKVRHDGNVLTLEQNCLEQNMLPSLAYGFKSCSQKYKIQPQDKFCNNWQPAKAEWSAGRKVVKFIGYDADEDHRTNTIHEDKKYEFRYPLVEWDMGRDECVQVIEDAGLCLPGKSACFFCPSSKPAEIRQLAANYPELADRALAMEANAELSTVKGLGRRFSWSNVLSQQEMFDEGYASAPEMTCGCYDG